MHHHPTTTSQTPPPLPSATMAQQQQQQQHHLQQIDPKLQRFYQPFQSYILNPNGRVLDAARRTHPKGFRYKDQSSPMERWAMQSYFKLPTHPPKRMTQEFNEVHSAVKKFEKKRDAVLRKAAKLDGFVLLRAAEMEDPSGPVEVSVAGKNLNGVVSEDLPYFTALRVLDAGDNDGLDLPSFTTLPNLEELHLHCNNLAGITGAEQFLLLHTLNVAFNRLTARDFLTIGETCPALQRLDFSHNNLVTVSRGDITAAAAATNGGGAGGDLGMLFPQLVQLALENNGIVADSGMLLSALSDLPRLEELNMNGNRIEDVSLVPPSQQQQQQEQHQEQHQPYVPFPSLHTIGLATNQIASLEAIAALSRLPALRRVILWGNPLSKQRRFEADLVAVEFESIGVEAVMTEPGKMRRANVGKFYNRNDCPFFAVEATDGTGLPRRKRKIAVSQGISHSTTTKQQQPQQGQQQHQQDVEVTIGEQQQQQAHEQQHDAGDEDQQQHTAGSFFMTEGESTQQHQQHRNTPLQQQQRQQQQQQRFGTPLSSTSALSNREHFPLRDLAGSTGGLPSPYGQPVVNNSRQRRQHQSSHAGVKLAPLPGEEGDTAAADPNVEQQQQQRYYSSESVMMMGGLQDPANNRYSAGATLRTVVSDLRRALRQPLPPLPL